MMGGFTGKAVIKFSHNDISASSLRIVGILNQGLIICIHDHEVSEYRLLRNQLGVQDQLFIRYGRLYRGLRCEQDFQFAAHNHSIDRVHTVYSSSGLQSDQFAFAENLFKAMIVDSYILRMNEIQIAATSQFGNRDTM